MARELRPKPGAAPAAAPTPSSSAAPAESEAAGLDPEVDEPSELDDRTHAEFIEIYRDASANIRFSKEQMWRTVLYFTLGTIAVASYGEFTRWSDPLLAYYLLVIVWVFSVASVLIIASLQWWQLAEHRKIDFVTSKWSSFANAARSRKSKGMSDVQRYGMLVVMILYLELVTIAVTRIFLLKI